MRSLPLRSIAKGICRSCYRFAPQRARDETAVADALESAGGKPPSDAFASRCVIATLLKNRPTSRRISQWPD